MNQYSAGCCKAGFQSNDAVWCFEEVCFFLCRMWCMVGHNRIDGSIQNTFHNRFAVFLLSERWIHAEVCIVRKQQFIGHHHIMRCCFAGNLDPSCFCFPDQLNRAFCADMCNVDCSIRTLCKYDLSCGDAVFACAIHAFNTQLFGNASFVDDTAIDDGQILTVADNWNARLISFFQSF